MRNTRDVRIDALKGILIVLVVLGHSGNDVIHDVVFLFHMPCFFMISGYFITETGKKIHQDIGNTFRKLLVPHFCYIILIVIFFYHGSIDCLLRYIYGGRIARGVFWYTTCLFVSVCLFRWLIKTFNSKVVYLVICVCGILAVIESNVMEMYPLLKNPGFPWSIDTALLAIVYIGIGFYGKKVIYYLLDSKDKKADVITAASILGLCAIFGCFRLLGIHYYFDMKPVYYRELISVVLIPFLFLVILLRMMHYSANFKFMCIFSFLGRLTLPIMYIHVYLNIFLQNYLAYGVLFYTFVGIFVPCIFGVLFSRWEITKKLFGIKL